ncbi:NAD(P)-dependent oxidoreductase [Oceanicoccus sp. KOV_DT_Chl]|uniref:NAD(P)-dependent oxidoreductase n=1 Tax=Oceanicoccus sp. KOV_DT_Chl TaxID=1904639 RepID=UPI000C7D2307|nr:NAD(P)-dependent oxidoreductase [Oceanicoccus sp. KOV_DT_Chl]
MSESKALAFIGLGVMGYPMAGHLQKAGHEVTVFNRNTDKARQWAEEYGGQWATTPAQAAANATMVFSCVGNDDDLRAVMLGEDGVLRGLAPAAIVVDHTTTSAEVAREVAGLLAAHGNGFIDAPVSGGQAGAINGQLTVMCGGRDDIYRQVTGVVAAYAGTIKWLGDTGAGQLAKMVNQICIAGLVQGLAEGLHFAQAADLDVAAVVEVISQGAAQSWQMNNRHQTMINGQYDHGFAVDWMRKDLAYVLEEARRNGSHLPVTSLVDQFYSEVQSLGGGRWDTSSLLARLEHFRK